MKRLIVATVALAAMTASSFAADIRPSRMEMAPVRGPAILPFHWGGWYAGLNLGGGLGDQVDGIVFGGQVGYNMQMSRWVFGIETDIQISGQSGSRSVVASNGATISVSQDLDWFGTLRGRVGYSVMDRWLPYFTAGLAYGGRSASAPGFTGDDTSIGWAIGVGVDYAFNQWWSARLEYLHVSLDGFNVRNAAGVTAAVGSLDNDIIRGAVNYRFMP
ncbi:MAG: porin family protein [Alphaproteobacteria bacterium]|nr:porin family protein [Alphaproteobacteria bacterium]